MALTILAILSLAAWAYLILGRGGYWRARERLEPSPEPPAWPDVVALIPARDEAAVIGASIASHMASDYPGDFSVVLVDDGSSDGTADIARASAAGRRTLDIVSAAPLEAGWTGKLWAMRAGIVRARERDTRYLLLTDADIAHAPQTLRQLVSKAESEELALVSLMAKLDARGPWGELLIPAFVYFFQKLYPFSWSNNSSHASAAAAGGCMLVRRDILEGAGGIDAIKDRLIDDCALAHLMKNADESAGIWTGLSQGEVSSLRDNRALSSVWSMVARTAFAQLDYSWLLLAGTIVGMGIVYLAPPLVALTYPLHNNAEAGVIALGAWIAMAASFLPTARLYVLAPWKTALLPAAAGLYALMTLSSGIAHARGAGGRWKGRTYP